MRQNINCRAHNLWHSRHTYIHKHKNINHDSNRLTFVFVGMSGLVAVFFSFQGRLLHFDLHLQPNDTVARGGPHFVTQNRYTLGFGRRTALCMNNMGHVRACGGCFRLNRVRFKAFFKRFKIFKKNRVYHSTWRSSQTSKPKRLFYNKNYGNKLD